MKKIIITTIVLIAGISGCIVLLCILGFLFLTPQKKPEVTCSYSVLENHLSTITYEVRFRIESPKRGFLGKPDYSKTLNVKCRENDWSFSELYTEYSSDERNIELSNDAEDVLLQSGYTEEIFGSFENAAMLTHAVENSSSVIAFQLCWSDMGNAGRKCAIFVYEKETQKLLYVAEIELNENYCFRDIHLDDDFEQNVKIVR